MHDLPAIEQNLRIARITGDPLGDSSDHLAILRNQLCSCEEEYPTIANWVKEKVVPGIKNGQRIGYVGYLDGVPIASAVIKRGSHAKFCHLRVGRCYENLHLGELFFTLMALEARNSAAEVHFTLPKGLWEQKAHFFRGFGFSEAEMASTQYRKTEPELRCTARFSTVWKAALGKLPKVSNTFLVGGHSINSGVVMSIHPRYATEIMNGKKRFEIRRRFSHKWIGSRVFIYATSPVSALVGEATVERIHIGSPGEIMEKCHGDAGYSKQDVLDYAGKRTELCAIELSEIRPYRRRMCRMELSTMLNAHLSPPQSYCSLRENIGWSQAVSLAALVQQHFQLGNCITTSLELDPNTSLQVSPRLSECIRYAAV